MTSEQVWTHSLGDKDKITIPLLLLKGKTVRQISDKYNLSKTFIRNKFYNILNIREINLGSKVFPYYKDEMMYGKNTHHYTMESLSEKEIDFYYKYKLKNKAYYEYK